MNSKGLFMKPWVPRFDPKKKYFSYLQVKIIFYSLPHEYWDLEILFHIGNKLGHFIMLFDITKKGRYTTYAQVCVFKNLSKPFLTSILLGGEYIIWEKFIDYEQIPFWCCRCHAYDHLFRDYPPKPPQPPKLGNVPTNQAPFENEFTILSRKRKVIRRRREGFSSNGGQGQNWYTVLQHIEEGNVNNWEAPSSGHPQEKPTQGEVQ